MSTIYIMEMRILILYYIDIIGQHAATVTKTIKIYNEIKIQQV